MKNCSQASVRFAIAAICCLGLLTAKSVYGQSFGVELQNTLMPASGGMGGTSIAQPQDLLSAINGNPATLTQYRGTQFTLGGGWVEPTINLEHTGNLQLPGVTQFSGKSQTPGSALGNIGVTQDLSVLGLPATAGVALISTAGLGVDYSDQPNSNASSLTFQVLTLSPSIGVKLTDRLSAGANFGLGISLFDGLFVGSSKATPAYGVRGTLGLNYDVSPQTKIGGYYQTKETFIYNNAVVLQPFVGPQSIPIDVRVDLPETLGMGIANNSLANGRLLLAADVVYKLWENASLFDAVYTNQLALQLGAQYTANRAKLRIGYVYAENAMVDVPGDVIGGVTPPGAANAIQYIQGLAPNINKHRFTMGIGVPNIMPGVDLDLFGGGMFLGEGQFGQTAVSVESYYVGGGMTWRFGRGSGCNIAPNSWVSQNCQSCQ